MAFLEFKNVKMAGMAAGVPKHISINDANVLKSAKYSVADFISTTGVCQKRTDPNLTTSDLCFAAAEKLIVDLGWDKSSIDGIIFVSQTPDYILPATSCILQDRLGLSKECYAADISLGCSGWVYGLSSAVALLQNGCMRRILLMAGDAKKRTQGTPGGGLFGSAGTVTALEYSEDAKKIQFHFGTDGSGYDAIIIPDGGSRNIFTPKSFELEEVDGALHDRLQVRMKGMDVFAFGITEAPKSVKKLVEHFSLDIDSFDYFVFHQANRKLNETIRRKLKLPEQKVPYCLQDFGNTSSASIPLTIVTQVAENVREKCTKFIACGFGVGLSWGTVAFETEKMIVSDLVEVES